MAVVLPGVSGRVRQLLVKVGVIVKVAPVKPVLSCKHTTPRGGRRGCHLAQSTLCQLLVWLVDEYLRIVYLDTDIWFWASPDRLFERKEAFLAYWRTTDPLEPNLQAMVRSFIPSRDLFGDMVAKLNTREVRAGMDRLGFSDQEYFNLVFGAGLFNGRPTSTWGRIPHTVMVDKKTPPFLRVQRTFSMDTWSPLEVGKAAGAHARGLPKPWSAPMLRAPGSISCECCKLMINWWKYYYAMHAWAPSQP